MTQETETVAMELNIVSCQTCDALFIESERRQTCPSCGGPPVGPYFQFVLDDSGLHRKDGAVGLAAAEATIGPVVVAEIKERYREEGLVRPEAVAELQRRGYGENDAELLVSIWDQEKAPEPEAPAAEAPAEEREPVEREEPDNLDVLLEAVKSYLGGVDALELDIREWLEVRLGAEPEAAAIAVGRLLSLIHI